MRCERMRATIRVAVCLARQQATTRVGPGLPFQRFLECVDCPQGQDALDGRHDDDDVERLLRMAEGGSSVWDGPGPEHNTDSGQDPVTEGMGDMVEMIQCRRKHKPRPVGTRCGECNKIHIQRYLDKKHGEGGGLVSKTTEEGRAPDAVSGDEKRDPEERRLTIDLSEYPELWLEIGRVAKDEERTMEQQVRYWLKQRVRIQEGAA